MPQPGKGWRHVIINTYGSWLPGDPRGFHSRRHRVHSSGDYKSPPPAGEHAGLHRFHQERRAPAIVLPKNLRPLVGRTFVLGMLDAGHRVSAACVAGQHAHALVELPSPLTRVRAIVGDCKRRCSRAVKHALPGRVWSAGGTYDRVTDRSHLHNIFYYIRDKQTPDAWVWTFRQGRPT